MQMCMLMFAFHRESLSCRGMKTKESAQSSVKGTLKKTRKPVFHKKVAKSYAIQQGVKSGFPIKEFCGRYHLLRSDLKPLTGYSLRALDKWAAGDDPSTAAKKHLKELDRLFKSLSELMESKEIGPWLKEPNSAFSDSTPMQVIERGESDRIWRMIYHLETGEPM
jgi:hypothetical protein